MKPSDFKKVTCKNCKRVSMGVTKKFAEDEVNDFNKFYKKKASLKNYKCCHNMDLRRTKKGECLGGATLSSVIWENF